MEGARDLHRRRARRRGPARGRAARRDLAVATGTHEPTLYRLLRALPRIGVFTELPDRRFANSEVSGFLQPDVPGSMYAMAMGCADWGWRNWGDLTESVRTEEEFRALYAAAGLRLTRVVRTASLFSLVEGVAE